MFFVSCLDLFRFRLVSLVKDGWHRDAIAEAHEDADRQDKLMPTKFVLIGSGLAGGLQAAYFGR